MSKDGKCSPGSDRNPLPLFSTGKRLLQQSSHCHCHKAPTQVPGQKGLKLDTRTLHPLPLSSLPPLLAHTYPRVVADDGWKLQKVSSHTQPGNRRSWGADSTLRPEGRDFPVCFAECVSIWNNQNFWPKTFLAPVKMPSSLLIPVMRSSRQTKIFLLAYAIQ